MSTDRFSLFIAECPIGCSISITREGNDKIVGTLLSIDIGSQALRIKDEDGEETFFFDEVKRWKKLITDSQLLTSEPNTNVTTSEPPQPCETDILQEVVDSSKQDTEEKKQENTIDRKRDDKIQQDYNEILNMATMTFGGENDLIPLPSPVFIIPDEVIASNQLGKTEIETIRNRSKSTYENAVKIGELSRLKAVIQSIKDIENRYSSYRIALLPQLCGLLLLKENPAGNASLAYDYLKKSVDWDQQDIVSLIGFAFVAMRQKQWEEAAESILLRLDKKETIEQQDEFLIKALGRCLLYADHSVPGLLSLKDKIYLQLDYFKYLMFLAVAKDSYEAAVLAYEKKYIEAKNTAPNSTAFHSISMLYKEEQPVVPFQDEELLNEDSNPFTGVVTYYPERQCGFINNTILNESFWFSPFAISDESLRLALANGITKELRDIRVAFEDTGYRPPNQSWNKAKNVRFASESERQRVFEKSQVQSAKQDTPIDVRLKAIPKDNSSYAKAKLAEQLNDLENQEHELTKTIVMGLRDKTPRARSAVLDLAALYNRQERADEALRLLDDYQSVLFTSADKDRLDNVRISIMIKAKRYEDVTDLIKEMLKRTPRMNARRYALLLQQHAFSLMMIAYQRKDKNVFLKEQKNIEKQLNGLDRQMQVLGALKAVQGMPQKLEELLNPIISEEVIKNAISDNVFSEIDEVQLPAVAKFLLEQYKLEDIDPRFREKILAKDIKDGSVKIEIERIKDTLKGKGKRLIQDYNSRLTLSALFWRYPHLCQNDDIKTNLRAALLDLSESLLYDRDIDWARVILIDALTITLNNKDDKGNGLLILSYLTQIPESQEIAHKQIDGKFLDYTLSLLAQDESACQKFAKDFPYYLYSFEEKSKQLLHEIRTKKKGFLNPPSSTDIVLQQQEEKRRIRREKEKLETLLKTDYPTTTVLSAHFASLYSLADETVFDLDKERFILVAETAERLPEIERQTDYLFADRDISYVETSIKNMEEEIKRRPSSLSITYVLDLLSIIGTKTQELRDIKQEKSAPQLNVTNLLQDDNYTIEPNGQILLQLKIELQTGSAPIDDLRINLVESQDIDFDKTTGFSQDQLRDSESRSITIALIPSKQYIDAEAFDIKISIAYRIITTGESCETDPITFPIRIGLPGEPINNPYDISGRAPVADPNKFVGRTEVINECVTQMTSVTLGKCYVLFGQMRCGKSSTMKQIQRRITRPCLAVYTDASSGESEGAQSMNFSLMIRDSLRKALSFALTDKEMDLSLFKEFKDYFPDESLLNSPVQTFGTMIGYAKEKLKGVGWDNPRIVLLIDEFTYIYQNIIKGKIDGSVMKHWKTMLQDEGFSAVLIGQDTMPWFLEKFANEFGVVEKRRISYLSKEEVFQMASDWILLPGGRSRYRGKALERLFEYTAGNPFYTQRFCYTLVEYLNKRKASIITEADIDTISFLLCRGGEGIEKIESSEFHPFYKPLDETRFTEEQYQAILRQIALETKRRGKAVEIRNIVHDKLAQQAINDIIEELLRREILEKEPRTEEVKIRVNLYTEYLWNNR